MRVEPEGNDRRRGRIGDAESYLMSARGLLAFALQAMTDIARDPGAAARLRP